MCIKTDVPAPHRLDLSVHRTWTHRSEGGRNTHSSNRSIIALAGNAHFIICHSLGVVLRQPPLSFEAWRTEGNKMRMVYAAPFPSDKIEKIAPYLSAINGKP